MTWHPGGRVRDVRESVCDVSEWGTFRDATYLKIDNFENSDWILEDTFVFLWMVNMIQLCAETKTMVGEYDTSMCGSYDKQFYMCLLFMSSLLCSRKKIYLFALTLENKI